MFSCVYILPNGGLHRLLVKYFRSKSFGKKHSIHQSLLSDDHVKSTTSSCQDEIDPSITCKEEKEDIVHIVLQWIWSNTL